MGNPKFTVYVHYLVAPMQHSELSRPSRNRCPSCCGWRLVFLLFVLVVLYLILAVILYCIATHNDDSSTPGEFVEEKRKVIHKSGLSEKVESRELDKRTNNRRVVIKKTGWKLNFLPTLLLMPLSFIPGMGSLTMRRRLCDLDVPVTFERRRLAAQKPSHVSWTMLLLQCLALGLADWYYLHNLRAG